MRVLTQNLNQTVPQSDSHTAHALSHSFCQYITDNIFLYTFEYLVFISSLQLLKQLHLCSLFNIVNLSPRHIKCWSKNVFSVAIIKSVVSFLFQPTSKTKGMKMNPLTSEDEPPNTLKTTELNSLCMLSASKRSPANTAYHTFQILVLEDTCPAWCLGLPAPAHRYLTRFLNNLLKKAEWQSAHWNQVQTLVFLSRWRFLMFISESAHRHQYTYTCIFVR